MKTLHQRCAGLDVHKVEVVACLRLVSKRKVEREAASSNSLEAFSAATLSSLSCRRAVTISASRSTAAYRCADRVGMVATNSAIMRASSRSFLARTPHALATWGIADPTASSIKRKQVLMSELGPEIFPEIA